MKTLQEIKEQVAFEYGWKGLISDSKSITDCPKFYIDEVSRRFATEVAKEALNNAADNAKITGDWDNEIHDVVHSVDKKSILSETNIPKL